MIVDFYNNLSPYYYVNKDIELIESRDIKAVNAVNVYNPIITIDKNIDFNYIGIPDLNAYYYVVKNLDIAQRIQINCDIDYLMSYKDALMNSFVIVSRYNNYTNTVDDEYNTAQPNNIYTTDTYITDFNRDGINIVLGVKT